MSDETTLARRVRGGSSELWTVVALVVVLALLPAMFNMSSTYFAGLLFRFLIFAAFAVALNIVFGHTNQLFLFVGSLAGLGAYTTVLLPDATGVAPWMVVPVAGIVAGIAGLVVSYVAARRRMTVIVIAILTLAIQLGLQEIYVGARDITGGSTGVGFRGLEVPFLTGLLGGNEEFVTYYTIFAFLTAVILVYWWLRNSKFGLAFKAIRQDEIASEAAGIDVIKYKAVAGFVAAAIIGLAGSFLAHSEGYVLPSLFTFQEVDVIVLIMLVLGGMRTIVGPVLGAALVIYINELLQDVGQWRTAVFGALLIVLFLFFRDGIVPKAKSLWNSDHVQSAVLRVRDRSSN